MAVALDGISFTHLGATRPALARIDLRIPVGQLVLVCGPSGGGKSTLLRLLTGAVPQLSGGTLSGAVTVLGRDPTVRQPHEMAAAGVAFVQQNPTEALVAGRVADEVAFGPRNLGVGGAELRSRVDDALRAVGLADRWATPVRTLSTGEQQRLALAATLAMRPRLLLADEPTAHLDPGAGGGLLALIAGVRRSGTTVLIAEHRLGLVAPLVDRAIVLADGAVIADGAPRTVLADRRLADHGVPLPRATVAALRLGVAGALPLTPAELADAIAR